MRKLLRSRRGSVAFATSIALVPVVGFVAIGGEAGAWYVTKQRAQSAADAAAYSGALRLACASAPQPGVMCDNAQTYDYRGRQAAAQNSFCNSGDTSYSGSKCSTSLPSGISQSVQVASLGTWKGNPGTFVQATISQQQPAYLARLLGLSTVTVAATAVARIDSLTKPPCVLALKDPITFQGSPTVSSPTCGIASNSAADNAIGFKGNSGIQVNAPSYTVGGCAQTGGSQCTGVKTYQQPIPDPLSGLSAAIGALKVPNDFPNKACSGSTVTSYEAGQCVNTTGNPSLPSTLNGTYYITGNLRINGNPTITGTATLIFFSGGSLSIMGNPTIQLKAVTSPAGPPALSATAKALMTDLLIYDDETANNVKITGSSSSYFNGTVYVPKSPITYSGNSSSTAPSTGCYQVIAYSVQFVGNTTLDNTKCTTDSATKPNVQTVRLMQQWQ